MHTDEPGMAQAASSFEGTAAALKGHLNMIRGIAEGLVPVFRGQTGTAFQASVARYEQAQGPLIAELDGISQNIRESGLSYGSTDSDGAALMQTSIQNL
ncbi:hypothetical protein BKN37_14515 [Mycobacterium talmoniae]|uniref:ESAT-6-like protein EsxB n=2 Tax=Mycobacterium talmoniae TaxID=1858794 RepID=A0A1S1NGJ5_9MYCO|nr:hypothetical protein BKN37_14515 [Mycobacterium talmoniae]